MLFASNLSLKFVNACTVYYMPWNNTDMSMSSNNSPGLSARQVAAAIYFYLFARHRWGYFIEPASELTTRIINYEIWIMLTLVLTTASWPNVLFSLFTKSYLYITGQSNIEFSDKRTSWPALELITLYFQLINYSHSFALQLAPSPFPFMVDPKY